MVADEDDASEEPKLEEVDLPYLGTGKKAKQTVTSKKEIVIEPAKASAEAPLFINRMPTGIEGFDELVEGGIPKDSLVLLSGSTGTGKSTFAMNFLVKGLEMGQRGCYISLEESIEETIRQMRIFNWDINKMIAEGDLVLRKPELYDFDELLMTIEDAVAKVNAERLVIDSISLISLYFQDQFKVRRAIFDLEKSIKNMGCTTIALSEVPAQEGKFSRFGVEEFVADGLIVLYMIKKENVFHRGISVIKMRATNHSLKVHPFQIEAGRGIVVYPTEELFTKF
ncbi:MAG: ATPase domain-containing protein [Candidatus Diapherotrites archaeon]